MPPLRTPPYAVRPTPPSRNPFFIRLSYEVAASKSDVSVGTLKSRFWRARSALRSRLEAGDATRRPSPGEPADDGVHETDRHKIDVLRRWFRENGRARG